VTKGDCPLNKEQNPFCFLAETKSTVGRNRYFRAYFWDAMVTFSALSAG
jgi:hypothetical protein